MAELRDTHDMETTTATAAEKFSRQIDRIQDLVNEVPGLSLGYIGGIHSDGTDDRLWMVTLPHPGRVGTPEDNLVTFAQGNLDAARSAASIVRAFVRGVRFAETVVR